MATAFEKVYGAFLSKISDYDLLSLQPENIDSYLYDLMASAITRFDIVCGKLDERDDTEQVFSDDLTALEIDILSEIMIEDWLRPKLFNSDLLRNSLSTKDFSMFSPANLLNQIRETYNMAHARSESMINRYSFTMNDVRELAKNDRR